MDANQLAAAGFYFTNLSDIVCSVFCGLHVCHWSEGYYVLKENQRWKIFCELVRVLCAANIPIHSKDQPVESPQQPNRSRDVCGPRFDLRPTLLSERMKW